VSRVRRGVPGVAVVGAGASLPDRVVTNDDLAGRMDTSDEWIRSRTGIRTRHWVRPGQSTSDLAVDAGRRALRSAGERGVDAVIVATTTPDRPCPAVAPEVATRLAMTGAAAHDVAATCTGFLYGLADAVGLIVSGVVSSALVIGAETYSTILSPADRGTAVIFGDGAGALVLRATDAGRPDDPGAIGSCVLGSDGTGSDLIQIPAGGSRQRSSGRAAAESDHYFQMRGQEVFRHAVRRMTAAAAAALARAGIDHHDIDHVVPHQANQRISDAVALQLGMDARKVLSNVATVGNTAAASIPLLLAQVGADGRVKPGEQLLLVAFGGGLTWGATVLVWPDIAPDCGYL
jgi:3-oxoacyl-[acyl-carrier-protein] synthase III